MPWQCLYLQNQTENEMERGWNRVFIFIWVFGEGRERPGGEEHYTIQKDTVPPSPPLHPFLPLSWSCRVCGVKRMVLIIANSALIASRFCLLALMAPPLAWPCAQGDHRGCLTGTMTTPTPCPGGPAHKDSTLQVFKRSLRPVCLAWAHLCGSNRVESQAGLSSKSSANSCQGLPCACRFAGMGTTTAAAAACTSPPGNTGSGRSVVSLPRGQQVPSLEGVPGLGRT